MRKIWAVLIFGCASLAHAQVQGLEPIFLNTYFWNTTTNHFEPCPNSSTVGPYSTTIQGVVPAGWNAGLMRWTPATSCAIGGGGGGTTVVEVNGTPISPASPANFVDTASVTWLFTGGQIEALAAGGGACANSGPNIICAATGFFETTSNTGTSITDSGISGTGMEFTEESNLPITIGSAGSVGIVSANGFTVNDSSSIGIGIGGSGPGPVNIGGGSGITTIRGLPLQLLSSATAPTGSCSLNGLWSFNRDLSITNCESGTWTNVPYSGGGGTVTSFAAPSGSWPTWLVPTVTTSTTTPSLAVAASAIPNSALATQTANTVLGALTATAPSGLALPSCSGASNALIWTTGTGFGCNTITSGTGISGATSGQLTIAGSPTTITASIPIAGGGDHIVSGSGASTNGNLLSYAGTSGGSGDSGIGSDGVGGITATKVTVMGLGPPSVQIGTNLFAALPACAGGTEGTMAPVTDSTTNTWGATITGGGADHVLAYCAGTNWKVAAQ